jgi:pyridoxamine 5'-phosphate oxidase
MDIKNCIDFTNANKISFFASVENDQPRVRALGFWFADETGFYFQIGGMKQLYRQLKKNPKAEVCFYDANSEKSTGTMLRIAGKIEFLNDKKLKEKVLSDRPFLKNFGLTSDSDDLIIFRIAHGEAHFWTMETNLKQNEIIKF